MTTTSYPLGLSSLENFPICKESIAQLHFVQFSHSVVSDSLRPHELELTRLPCPSPTPRAYPNSCPLHWWCHPTISSSVVPFSSCLQSFPELRSFPMSQFFASDGQSIGVSASTSVLLMNIQDWFPLGWSGWISWQSKGLSRVFSSTTVQKHQFFSAQPSLWSNSHIRIPEFLSKYQWDLPRTRTNNLKFVWKYKRPWVGKRILGKKNGTGRYHDFKLYCKATVTRTVYYWHKTDT